jgi:hypothetical protein
MDHASSGSARRWWRMSRTGRPRHVRFG